MGTVAVDVVAYLSSDKMFELTDFLAKLENCPKVLEIKSEPDLMVCLWLLNFERKLIVTSVENLRILIKPKRVVRGEVGVPIVPRIPLEIIIERFLISLILLLICRREQEIVSTTAK